MNPHLRRFVRTFLALLGLLLLSQLLLRLFLQLRRTPIPPRFGFLLRSRLRRSYRSPAETLAPLSIQPGMTVLEVGPGTGLFTLEAARQVGPNGKLICIDLQPTFTEQTSTVVEEAGVRHVELHVADVVAMPLPPGSVDRAFLVAVLPEVPDVMAALMSLQRVLRPGGLLLISEEVIAPEYVPPAVTRRWAARAGFELVSESGNFFCYSQVYRNP